MQGKTVVVTGATSGIGEVAAIRLAERGARIVLVARDRERAKATIEKIAAANPLVQPGVHLAELSLLSEMKRVGRAIAAAEPKIDVLINNAGGLFSGRSTSRDGLAITFAVNHMSYFVLTNFLLDSLKNAPQGRIVSTSSSAHSRARIDFNNLNTYGFDAYCQSKLCNILFTRELSRRLADTRVTANCLHPGFVATRFGNSASPLVSVIAGGLKAIAAISPENGAKTIIYLASSSEVLGKTGKYWVNCAEKTPSSAAQSDEAAKRLWDISARLAEFDSRQSMSDRAAISDRN
jgi:NAD(P)-dependent dehydrogenase (short-subunit alcohol dehydrogenase family)